MMSLSLLPSLLWPKPLAISGGQGVSQSTFTSSYHFHIRFVNRSDIQSARQYLDDSIIAHDKEVIIYLSSHEA